MLNLFQHLSDRATSFWGEILNHPDLIGTGKLSPKTLKL